MVCPNRQELSDFALGKLAEGAIDTVAQHVDTCPDCQKTITQLAPTEDTFVAKLKQVRKVPGEDAAEGGKNRGSLSPPPPPAGKIEPPPIPSSAGTPSSVGSSASGRPMTVSCEAFAQSVTQLGLIEADEATAITNLVPTEKRGDAQAVAKLYIERGKLTKYQAAAIYQGKAATLTYGDYLVLDRIGAGGMGQVFKARHRRMDRIVALKVMSAAAMNNADAVKRFEREVKAAAKLSHNHIVTAFDAGAQDGMHYLVMELVDGPDLSALLKKHGKLPVKNVVDFITQAAKGLAFAHSKGVVHRDIKPGNLLVDSAGVVKILDMGLARLDHAGVSTAKTDHELTQSGAVMGTVDYMAPEQALNTRHADAKSDVYSLGCTLYRLITGEPMYAGETMVEKILAHREQAVPSLRTKRADAPPALDAVFQRMTAKKPDQRPSMQEIAEALGSLDSAAASLSGLNLSGPSSSGVGLMPGSSGLGLPSQEIPIAPPMAPVVAPTIYAGSAPLAPVRRGEGQGVRGSGPAGTKPQAKAGGPPKKKSNFALLAAAGAAAAIAFGIWVYIKDKDGKTIASLEVPDGGTVTLMPPPAATPRGSAAPHSNTPGDSPGAKTTDADPNKFFALPQGTATAAVPPAVTTTVAPPVVPIAATVPSTPSAVTPPAPSAPYGNLYFYPQPFARNTPCAIFDTLHYDGSTPLTVEGWIMPSPTTEVINHGKGSGSKRAEVRPFGIDRYGGGIAQLGLIWHVDVLKDGTDAWKLEGTQNVAGQKIEGNLSTGQSIPAPRNVPQHFAWVLQAKAADGKQDFSVWIDGRRIKYGTGEFVYIATDPFFSQGFLDELRVSKVARYSADFTPAKRFEPDADTIALYHCDEGSGDRLLDASGNHRHGQLINAAWAPTGTPPGTPLPAPATAPPLATTPTSLDPTAAVDLLSLVQLPRDAVAGTWTRNGTALSGTTRLARIQVPYTPPSDEYDLILTGRRLTADRPGGGVVIGMVSQGEQSYFIVNDSFATFSDRDAEAPPNYVDNLKLNFDAPTTFVCSVRKNATTLSVNGQTVLEYRGRFDSKQQSNLWAVPRKDQLFLGVSGDNAFEFSSLKLVAIGAAAPIATTPPPTAAEVDLLALVQLPRDAVKKTWTRNGTKLTATGSPHNTAVLQLPNAPTVPEFDLILSAQHIRKDSQWDGVTIGLVGPNGPLFLRVGPDSVGISDDDSWKAPNLAANLALPMTQPFTLKVALRRNAVTAEFNGRQIFEFRGELPVRRSVHLTPGSPLFLGVEGTFDFSAIQFVPVGATAQIASVGLAVAPGPTVPAADPAIVCTKLATKAKPVGLHPGAAAFDLPPGDGRSGANGFLIAAPARWQGQGTVWDFTYRWSGTAHTVIMIHPTGGGHLRVHLQKDRVDVFPGGAWSTVGGGYLNGSKFPITIEAGAAKVFPLPADVPIRVTSRIGGAGAYSLSLNGTPIVSCRVSGLPPQQMKPPITDAACPATLGVGQAALLIGPRDGGVHEATDVRLTSGDGGTLTPGQVATTSPLDVPTQFAPLTPTAPAAAPPAERKPVPDAATLTETTKLIKDIFKDDYADALKSPEKKSPLAQKLLQQAGQAGNEPAQMYALLDEAKKLAIDSGDLLALRGAIESLTREFEIERTEAFTAAWDEFLRKPRTPQTVKVLHDEAVALFGPAVGEARFDDAKRYADFALNAARRVQDVAVVKQATDRNLALAARRTEWEAVKTAAEKLQDAPDDAAANLAIGRYRVFVEGDWARGLPLLSKGSDDVLKGLAEKSVVPAPDAAALTAIADAWWDAAQTAPATKKAEFYAGALNWYKQAALGAQGLSKTRIDKRVTDSQAAIPEQKLPPTRLASLPQFTSESAPVTGDVPKVFDFGPPGSTALPPTQPAGPSTQPAGPLAPPTTTRPLPAGFRLPPNAVPGLIGRLTLTQQDGPSGDMGVLFTYTPGRKFMHSEVAKFITGDHEPVIQKKGITVQLAGVVHVPADMEVAIQHANSSSTLSNAFLYLDGKEISNVGDDKAKNVGLRVPLSKGEHAIGWKIRGGLLGGPLLDFFDGKTGEPLAVYATADIVVSARSLPTRQQIDNSSDEKLPPRPPTLPPAPPTPPPPGVGSTFNPPSGLPLTSNPPTTPSPAAPGPVAPGSAPPAGGDADRRAAEWLAGKGATFTFQLRNGRVLQHPKNPIPAEPFQIVSFSLRNKSVTDAELVNVAGLRLLRQVDLAMTAIHGGGLQNLAASADSLNNVNVDGSTFGDAGLATIGVLKNLQALNLNNTQVSDRGLPAVTALKHLGFLGLSGTQIGDAGLGPLAGMVTLTNLPLRTTKVTDAGMAALTRIVNLESVDVASTAVTDAGIAHLTTLRLLKLLNLGDTKTTAAGILKVQQTLPECRIVISNLPPERKSPQAVPIPPKPTASGIVKLPGGFEEHTIVCNTPAALRDFFYDAAVTQAIPQGGEITIRKAGGGVRAPITYKTQFSQIKSVVIRGRILPEARKEFRIACGEFNGILNWQDKAECHFRTGEERTVLTGDLLTPGQVHVMQFTPTPAGTVFSLDGKPLYEAGMFAHGSVTIYTINNHAIALESIVFTGIPDPTPVTDLKGGNIK